MTTVGMQLNMINDIMNMSGILLKCEILSMFYKCILSVLNTVWLSESKGHKNFTIISTLVKS